MDWAEGIIIKKTDSGESDRIVSVYTKELGRSEFLVKGGRKILAKIAPHLELFNYVKINYVQGKNLKIITGAEVLNSFPALRKDLDKILIIYNIINLFNKFITGQAADLNLFNLLFKSLSNLNNNVLVNPITFEKSFTEDFFKIYGT